MFQEKDDFYEFKVSQILIFDLVRPKVSNFICHSIYIFSTQFCSKFKSLVDKLFLFSRIFTSVIEFYNTVRNCTIMMLNLFCPIIRKYRNGYKSMRKVVIILTEREKKINMYKKEECIERTLFYRV